MCPFYVCDGSGVNCVTAVLMGLAAARGLSNAEECGRHVVQITLGITSRVVLAGRLPVEAIKHLVDAGQIKDTAVVRIFSKQRGMASSMPLLPAITT